MRKRPKAATIAETLKYIQQNRIAYGADERARYVEHVCGLLLNDRFWPGASDDMLAIEDHEAWDALPSWIDVFEWDAPCGSPRVSKGGRRTLATSHPFAIDACTALPHGQASAQSWDASVRTWSPSDRATAPHLQLLGHLNQSNAPPNRPPVLGRITQATVRKEGSPPQLLAA